MALFDDTFPPYVAFGSRNLAVGSAGTDVAVVQAVYNLMLETMNPPHGPMGNAITVTGLFDGATQVAVKNIQSYFGLAVDGIVGPVTFFVFGQGVGSFITYGGPVFGSRQLTVGNSGGDVIILQNRLNCFAYAALTGGPTGTFDSGTAQAVLAFKHDAENNGDTGFPPNDIAGFGFYNASWLYTFAGGRSIESGRNGFDVVFVQALLLDLGYYSGNITGYYDAKTVSAVKKFQTAMGIASDGIVGPSTFYQLGLNNNVPAPVPLGVSWPPSIVPKVTACSVPLVTQSTDLHPYGVASLVINQREGFESLDVVGNFLPDPSTFGSRFTQYTFTLTDPRTGQVIVTAPMVQTPTSVSPEDWVGTFSPGVKTIVQGIVTIYPSGSGGLGPSVLSGNLQQCI
jgi:peptidoglycan hydrolase-like protein with peptidoglycan-binding domain